MVSECIIFPEAIQERFRCNSCEKYCSVKPVQIYQDGSVKCGRCFQPKDDGAVSLFNKCMDTGIWHFYCINRWDGCDKVLHCLKVLQHEQFCHIDDITCPVCKILIPSLLVHKHIIKCHSKYLINRPEIIINIGSNNNENFYFYTQQNRVFIIIYRLNRSEKILLLAIFYIGSKGRSKNIVQKITMYEGADQIFDGSPRNCHTYDPEDDELTPYEIINITDGSVRIHFEITLMNFSP